MTPLFQRVPTRRRRGPMPPQPTTDRAEFTMGPATAPVGCLLIHGFSGSPLEMRWLGEYLAGQGVRVEGVRLAGHGTRPEELKHLTWRDWLKSAEDGLERLLQLHDKVVIVGFSMGGLLGLHLCARRPSDISRLVTISTPVYFRDRRIHLIPMVRHVVPWHNVRRPGTSVDPEAHTRYHSYRRYPLIAVDQLLNLMRVTRKVLPTVKTPALIMQGVRDDVVDPRSAQYLFDHIGSRDKDLVFWHNSAHGVVFDAEREEVWRRVHKFALTGA
jgi:carboxylesterase